MTNFDPATLDWATGLLAGWTYDKPVNKWFQGAFRHAHRLTRPCPTCTAAIVLDVTAKALEGKATNHGLALRRCKECRKALKAGPQVYAARKAEVADKPAAEIVVAPETVVAAAVTTGMSATEAESLRTANITMKEELAGLYATIKELRDQLSQYELAPAIERVAAVRETVKPVERGPVERGLVAAFKPPQGVLMPQYIDENAVKPPSNGFQQNKLKMPWEGG